MAHFAQLDQDNKVIRVNVVHNNELLVDGVENEQKGIDFLHTIYASNTVWKQTSYNTLGDVHGLGGTPFRKNYAGIGFTYDEERDAFIPPQEFPSWTLNEDTCHWEPPVSYPTDGNYQWNEETTSWDKLS